MGEIGGHVNFEFSAANILTLEHPFAFVLNHRIMPAGEVYLRQQSSE